MKEKQPENIAQSNLMPKKRNAPSIEISEEVLRINRNLLFARNNPNSIEQSDSSTRQLTSPILNLNDQNQVALAQIITPIPFELNSGILEIKIINEYKNLIEKSKIHSNGR